MEYKKWRHAKRNLIFLLTSLIINVLFGLATVGIFLWIDKNQFGILNLITLNLWLELLIAVMVLDLFAQWVTHYFLHRVKWMWKFHLVHHSDINVDVTTGSRHHPGDYLMREMASLMTIMVFGIPIAFYIFYRICTIFFAYTSHANIKLPRSIDKALSLIFITPNMHKFHHHFERPWTDSNFGNIFSLWDHAFGTYVYEDLSKIKYGVDVIDPSKSEDVLFQFKLPLDKSIKTDY